MTNFEQELRASAWVHRPLPLHGERSLEAQGLEKPVLGKPVSFAGGRPLGRPLERATLQRKNSGS